MAKRYKKILIIGAEVQPIPPVEGGAVEQLVDLILKDNEKDHYADFTVISPYTRNAEKESKKYRYSSFFFVNGQKTIKAKLIDFMDLFSRRFFDHSTGIYYLKKVCHYLKNNQNYDLIIIENRPLFAQHIKKYYKGPLYLHLHNDFISNESRHLKDILGNHDRYIVISEYLKKRVSEVENKTITVLYNGIDFTNVQTPKKGDKKDIIYAGRLVSDKGILELIDAYKLLNINDTTLTIIGTYDEGADGNDAFIKRFEESCKDQTDIKLIGKLPNSEVFQYYAQGYVGVVPSVVNEALSLTAIEMLGSGLPIIATDAGGLPEVVDENCGIVISRNGLENNIASALERILSDENYRNRLAENALIKALKFTKERYLKEFKRIVDAD